MAFCSKCGAQLDSALKFCTACGTPTAPQQPQPMQAQPPQYQQPYAQPQVQQPYAPAPVPPPPPAKKKSKAPLVIVAVIIIGGLVAAGIFTNGFGLFGGKGGAITVSGIVGENAALANGQAVKNGAKLTAGSRLTTGAETYVYLKVAEDCILKMDEYSEISLSEISGGVLKFDLVQGSILVNENGPEGRVQMTAGNTLLIVRGTFFTAKYDSGDMAVDLIAGEIDVTTDSGSVTNVEQGSRVTVSGDGDAVVDALDVSQFDTFTMGSVMEYKNVLTDGSLSETDFSRIADRLDGGGSETGGPVYDGSIADDWGEAGGSETGGGSETDGSGSDAGGSGSDAGGSGSETDGGGSDAGGSGSETDGGGSDSGGGGSETDGGEDSPPLSDGGYLA